MLPPNGAMTTLHFCASSRHVAALTGVVWCAAWVWWRQVALRLTVPRNGPWLGRNCDGAQGMYCVCMSSAAAVPCFFQGLGQPGPLPGSKFTDACSKPRQSAVASAVLGHPTAALFVLVAASSTWAAEMAILAAKACWLMSSRLRT